MSLFGTLLVNDGHYLQSRRSRRVLKSAVGILPFFLNDPNKQSRHISRGSSIKSVSHYYDVLGITPNATQNQIKSAYYKMSKLHHPDVSDSKKSHSLFTEINEAYEVLGNISKRRLYDKGVYKQATPHSPNYGEDVGAGSRGPEDSYANYYRNHNFERGQRPPPPQGRSRIYNFDEFYRQHYNDIREKKAHEHREHARYEEILREERQNAARRLPMGILVVLWSMIFSILMVVNENRDRNRIITRPQKPGNGRKDPLKSIDDQD